MMAHVTGQSRYQTTLFPEVLDEVVSIDDPVRVIDAFVETLDLMALGFSKVAAEEMGRPPDAGVQDHCGLPQGPCGSDCEGMPRLYPVLPGAVAVRRRVVGD